MLGAYIVSLITIPPQFVDGSVHCSVLGKSGFTEETNFLVTNVIGFRKQDWKVSIPDLDAGRVPRRLADWDNTQVLEQIMRKKPAFRVLKCADSFRAIVKDSHGNIVRISGKPDNIIVPTMLDAQSTLEQKVRHHVLFVEIESGNKGLDFACEQLLATMKAASATFRQAPLFGVAILSDFSCARLLRVNNNCAESDGQFIPSQLPILCDYIVNNIIPL